MNIYQIQRPMETQTKELFIVEANDAIESDLKKLLQTKFGDNVHISTFKDGESCLAKVDKDTSIVLLDHKLNGHSGLDILKSIKAKNSATEVILLSEHKDIEEALESIDAGALGYLAGEESSKRTLAELVAYILMTPVRLLTKEFGLSKYIAMIVVTFIAVALVVFIALAIW